MIKISKERQANIKDIVKRKSSGFFINIIRYALIICLSFLILTPILQQLSTAFKSPYELGSPVSIWIPGEFSIEHIVVSLKMLDYTKALPYTLATTAMVMLLQTISSALAGYAFARLKFKGSGLLFGCVILTIVIPPQVVMLPQYMYFRNFDIFGIIKAITGKPINLLNSPLTLYMLSALGMGLKSGLYIYIFRQFFRGLPKELEEAAFVDGAGFLRTFFSIVLPSAKSSLITVSVLSFVWNWNDSYFVGLFNKTQSNLMVALNTSISSVEQTLNRVATNNKGFSDGFAFLTTNPLYQSAIAQTASLMIMLPLIILYLFIQKEFVEGAERSGIVG